MIQLTQGRVATVDKGDVGWLSKHKWHFEAGGYACRRARTTNGKRHIWMHREIMECPEGMVVDHINGDKLDNRKDNLRVCTYAQNAMNRRPGERTGYRGVIVIDGRYQAVTRVEGNPRLLGKWNTAEEAARAHDAAAIQYRSPYVRLNFLRGKVEPKTVSELRLAAKRAYKRVKVRGPHGYTGVTRTKRGDYAASFSCGGIEHQQTYGLGWYKTAIDAAKAYDAAARHFLGEDAKLNFPDQDIEPASPEQLRKLARTRPQSSPYFGVYKNGNGKWASLVVKNGRKYILGTYRDELSAAKAYDSAAVYYGVDAFRLNFPDESPSGRSPMDLRREAWGNKGGTSRFRGVRRVDSRKWGACIQVSGTNMNLGRYSTQEEAAKAYDLAAYGAWGDRAMLNFPDALVTSECRTWKARE